MLVCLQYVFSFFFPSTIYNPVILDYIFLEHGAKTSQTSYHKHSKLLHSANLQELSKIGRTRNSSLEKSAKTS